MSEVNTTLPIRGENPIRIENKEKEYHLPEEIVCAITHAFGGYLGAAAIVILVFFAVLSDTQIAWKVVSASIFGASVVILYSASTLYHAVTNPRIKELCRSFDQMAIYILIAGSYTPFCLVVLRQSYPVLSWTIFGCVWGMALSGILMELLSKREVKYVTPVPYLVMGWFGLALIPPLSAEFSIGGFFWLILGGVLYSLGVLFYLWRRLPYNHAVWHIFVLAGTIAHFFCILFYVMM